MITFLLSRHLSKGLQVALFLHQTDPATAAATFAAATGQAPPWLHADAGAAAIFAAAKEALAAILQAERAERAAALLRWWDGYRGPCALAEVVGALRALHDIYASDAADEPDHTPGVALPKGRPSRAFSARRRLRAIEDALCFDEVLECGA